MSGGLVPYRGNGRQNNPGGLFTPDNLGRSIRFAKQAYKHYKNYTKTPPGTGVKNKKAGKASSSQTNARRGSRRSRGSGGRGSSGGKFDKGLSVKGDKASMYMSKGIVKTLETSITAVNNDCCIIGHSTRMPQEELKMTAKALLKSLISQDLDYVTNMDDTISLGVLANITITYYIDPLTTALTTDTIPIALVDTYQTIAGLISTRFDGIMNSGGNRVQFESMTLNKLIGAVYIRFARINLSSTTIHYWTKSDMKIQNRSTNEASEEIDVVDQVPIYGKSYEGKGNGTILKGTRFIPHNPVIADENTGLILASTAGSSAQALREPPAPKAFIGIKKFGKQKLEPGEIKTSTLNVEWKANFNVWFSELQRVGGGYAISNFRISTKGLFRFFALEKMIALAGETPVILGLEVNAKYGCYITHKKKNVTQAQFN